MAGHPLFVHDKALSRWRWVAKLSLLTGIAAAGIFAGLVLFLGGQESGDYAQLIRAHSLTRAQLGPALLLAGLCLLAVISISTWLVALYSSFRIAGPLYRFQQNLQAARQLQPQLGIRHEDGLQGLSTELRESVSALYAHYGTLRELVDEAEQCLQLPIEGADTNLADVLQRLKEVEQRVRLDD